MNNQTPSHQPNTVENGTDLKMTVYASLFAALTAVGAFIAIPIGPVPIVLQNLFIFLAGLLLGPKWGTASVAIYLFAGALGLPVFAGGTGGAIRFAGPTGGYLIAFLPAVLIIGLISRMGRGRVVFDITAMVVGTLVIYALGAAWLGKVTGFDFDKALAVGVTPFLVGDAVKMAAAVPIARALRPMMWREPRGGQGRSQKD
jgi:biotin transport system substrate-specific component